MSVRNIESELIDNGRRRIGVKWREFSYTNHVPADERSEKERRNGVDRRSGLERRKDKDRRSGMIIFKTIQRPENDLREGMERRSGLDRRIAFTRDLFT